MAFPWKNCINYVMAFLLCSTEQQSYEKDDSISLSNVMLPTTSQCHILDSKSLGPWNHFIETGHSKDSICHLDLFLKRLKKKLILLWPESLESASWKKTVLVLWEHKFNTSSVKHMFLHKPRTMVKLIPSILHWCIILI